MSPISNKPLIIIGGGGHSKVLIDALHLLNQKILGILDANKSLHNSQVLKIPILGSDEMLSKYPPSEVELINGIGSTQSMESRRDIFQKLSIDGYTFKTII